MLKKHLSKNTKIQCKLLLIKWKDWRKSYRFAKRHNNDFENYPYSISLSQHFIPNEYLEAKKHNLQLAISFLQNIEIQPKEVFSFWKLVGQPTLQRGFVKGRNLVQNQLTASEGGGLCQLAGILYHAALLSGMTIIERYAHSQDIYTNETRFSPLGADAAVVFGYKDFRFQNPFDFPIVIHFELEEKLTISIKSPKEITPQQLEFKTTNLGFYRKATTFVNGYKFKEDVYQIKAIS